MLTIYADAESFYSKEYSLRKMTPPEYILGAQWETIGWGVAENNDKPFWLEGDEFETYLKGLRHTPYRLVTHNALFDASIIGWRYGLYPTLCVDTMSMARALLSHVLPRGSVSLENVGNYLSVGQKGHTVHNVVGMGLEAIKQAGLYMLYVAYCLNDVEICRAIYKQLAPSFPATEFVINDMIIKMATRPQFQVNEDKLYLHLATIQAAKQNLLDRVGIDKKDLMSNDKFALALERLGVEPPKKVSPTTGKVTWAFAKTDEGFSALEDDPNPDVQALHSARVGHKSTLEESRTERFINISRVTYDGNSGWMPIALRFSGAHTHRFSGDWKLNEQNLPSRGDKTLRESLVAPDGYVVVTVDAAQIEARLTAWLSGQWDLVDQFERGEDVYSIFASDIYGFVVTKKNKKERFLGKTSVLGLGFGMGAAKFQNTVRIEAHKNGFEVDVDLLEAERIVNLYRFKNREIKKTWHWLNNHLPAIANGQAEGIKFGPCIFEKQAILLPNGLRLRYEGLHYADGEWNFTYAGKPKRIYGGKMLENMVQALDRVHVMEAAVRIQVRSFELGLNLPLAHQVHDELVYVVPAEQEAEVRALCLEEMERRPSWGPDLPLAAEAGSGPSYGEIRA